jgi:D-alanyl-D-alanine carboxypeptidase/D-alanyl-D-alanine-endopeptidase (penicillin-binding protein 4)
MSLPKRLLLSLTALVCGASLAQKIPPDVAAALERAKVPLDAVTLLVVDAEGRTPARLSHRTQVPVNPASVMKLVTTYAGLDLLGPAYTWATPVFIEGAVREGTLFGNLVIKGQGDPKLVAERLWLLLRRVQGLGIDKIAGDIVLDRSAFESIEADPASFDGEPLRPYNASPDALLLNFKSVVMTFVPDRTANTAQVYFEPPLAGVQMQTTVPLTPGNGNGAAGANGANGNGSNVACGDYRTTLKADFSDPTRIRFAGSYPLACAEKVWTVAYADPKTYNLRAVEGLWRAMGGQLGGTVRAAVPASTAALTPVLTPVFEMASPALAEVIRDINKFSNNVMAQQLFLTLSLPVRSPLVPQNGAATLPATALPASREASRAVISRWWRDRIGPDDAPTMDNGSGLSRSERISAQALARMLQTAYRSPLMPELMSSLPIAGVDGTLRRSKAVAQGSAHLKTGSLRDVTALAGYVHGASGKRYVLVAMANHPNANAVRPAFDALVDWTVRD